MKGCFSDVQMEASPSRDGVKSQTFHIALPNPIHLLPLVQLELVKDEERFS